MAGINGVGQLAVRVAGEFINTAFPKPVARVPAPIAEWGFSETAAPFKSTAGDLPLAQGASTAAATRVETPWGFGVAFAGASFLRLAAASVGRLNIGGAGKNTVTVAAWVKHTDTNAGFVAGCWQEDNGDPRRQYGLFYDLHGYGGDEKSNFHVSKTGGPTPGYAYSRDYAASGNSFTRDVWQLHVGTYDGQQAISYLQGIAQAYPSYTDSLGNTYSKNPYLFPLGLNGTPCDFTVGACTLTAGPGNFMVGQVAKLRVWDKVLTAAQVKAIFDQEKTAIPSTPVTPPTEPTNPTTPPPSTALRDIETYDAWGDSSGTNAGTKGTYGIDYNAPDDLWPRQLSDAIGGMTQGSSFRNLHKGGSMNIDVLLRALTTGTMWEWKFDGVRNHRNHLVTILCSGNDAAHYATAAGKAGYEHAILGEAALLRGRQKIHHKLNESGAWTAPTVQVSGNTRQTTVKGAWKEFQYTGPNGVLYLMGRLNGLGTTVKVTVDGGTPITVQTANQGEIGTLGEREPNSPSGQYVPIPVLILGKSNALHTIRVTHDGVNGEPLIVDCFVPWALSEDDMPMVIMVPAGKSTAIGYAQYDAPRPNDTVIAATRVAFNKALDRLGTVGNLIRVTGTEIDQYFPAGAYSYRIQDGLHPNLKGHNSIFALMWKVVKRFLLV